MLLVEYSILDNVKVINESKNGVTKLKLLGKFQKCDEQNNNGRVYPRSILESQVKAIQGKIDERSLVGALDHPANDAIHLSQASHLITKLWVEKNGDVMGEAEILSTPNGKIVEALIGDGVKIGISSRGLGSVSENSEGKIVNEDFKLITFDLVSDPSTKGAFPEMCESMRENSQRAQTIISKHKKDRVLMTMLESMINESLNEGFAGPPPNIPANKKVLATRTPTAEDLAKARKRDRKADADRAANPKTPGRNKRQRDRILNQPQGRANDEAYDVTGEASQNDENKEAMDRKKAAEERAKRLKAPFTPTPPAPKGRSRGKADYKKGPRLQKYPEDDKPFVSDRNSTNLRNSIVDRLKSVYDSKMNEERGKFAAKRANAYRKQHTGTRPVRGTPDQEAAANKATGGKFNDTVFAASQGKVTDPGGGVVSADKAANTMHKSGKRAVKIAKRKGHLPESVANEIVERLKSVFESKMSDLDVQRQERKGGVQKFSTRLHMRRAKAAADRNVAKSGPAKLPGDNETKQGLDSLTLNKRK
jgi:hypothetical protein